MRDTNHEEKLNGGFTLLECLIALSLMTGLLLFLTPFIKQVNRLWEYQEDASYLEVQIGKRQLEHEIEALTLLEVKPAALVYKKVVDGKADERIVFDMYEDKLRKKPGFQPIIVGLKSVSFIEFDSLIEMTLVTLEGEEYVYFLKK
ncbi:competence type IV pilus minor pilin ComGF [Vagococcus bubulae]|nr:competence type IV pilus minor pilin ComGF [Vagococcus bubulae]